MDIGTFFEFYTKRATCAQRKEEGREHVEMEEKEEDVRYILRERKGGRYPDP